MAPDSDHRAAAGGAGGRGDLMERAVDGAIRLVQTWKSLSRERRAAAIAAGVLWLTLFLPWYQASVVSRNPKTRSSSPIGESLSGWAAFSGVQALILILSLGTILLLFLRAEGRLTFSTANDGWAVTVAGALSVFLVVLGLFNAPSPATRSQYVLSTGLEWGIFLALLAAIGMTWAGGRMRRSLEEDPILARRQRPEREGEGYDFMAPEPDPAAQATGTSNPATQPTRTASQTPQPQPSASRTPPPRAKPPVEAMTEANRLGVVEPLTDEAKTDASNEPQPEQTRPGAGQPLTAAAAKRPRPVRAASGQSEAATHDADAVASGQPVPEPSPAPAPAPGPRSNWRPAESPAWKDPNRRTGWLTAPRQTPPEPAPEPETEPGAEPPTRQSSAKDQEQLTIPLEPDE